MKKYEKYKDSGIEWLGEIPEHWDVVKLKYVVDSVETGKTPSTTNENYFENGNIEWYSPGDFTSLKLGDSNKKITDLAVTENKLSLYPKNTILLVGIGATLGKVALTDRVCFTNQQINAIIPSNKMNPYFGLYYLDSIKEEIRNESNASTMAILNQSKTKDLIFILPPKKEQTAIASFLDHLTTQIDTLIEKKEQLIEKLKLQRQAIINEAVTGQVVWSEKEQKMIPLAQSEVKGKDSGIEWLGEIPEHWEVNYIKRGLKLLTDYEANGSFDSIKKNVEFTDDTGYAWYVRATDLENSLFLNENNVRWVDDKSYQFLHKTKLHGGELLVAKRGEIGKVYLMPEVDIKATLAPNLYLVRLNERLDSEFTWYYFESEIGKGQLKLKNRSTTMGALYKDDFKEISIVFPPIQEQINIRKELKMKCERYSNIINKIDLSIVKLKLYRQSIISEAVTGKIDVRDWESV